MFWFFSLKPLFNPKKKPLKIAVLFSGNASSAYFVLEERRKNPELRKKLEFVGAFTDNRYSRGMRALESLGLDVASIDFNRFCIINKLNPKDLNDRKKYFKKVLWELKQMNPDIIMLSGFMKIITEPVLSAFNYRMLNVHPADLTILENKKPKFKGDRAVLDALLAGQDSIKASIHFVTTDVDCGPVLVVSKPLKVDKKKVKKLKKNKTKLKEYAEFLQEKLKRSGDDPAFLKALELIADGKVALRKGKVYIKEKGKWKQGYYDLESDSVKH